MKQNSASEEIPASEVEVLNTSENKDPEVIRISANDENSPFDRSYGKAASFEKLFQNIDEFKRIRFFGPLALLLSIIGFMLYPLYLEPLAAFLAVLDLWKGSKFTRKISILALILAGLALLNAWT